MVAIRRLWEGSPLQGFGTVDTSEPRAWSPLQGYAPWALKGVAPLGLAPPPGNCQGTRLSGHNTPPRTTRDKRAALWQEPRWGKEPCFGKGPCCGKSRSAGHPRRASGLQPRACPNGRTSPYRGDPSPEPRVRSPARATKPWVNQPSIQSSVGPRLGLGRSSCVLARPKPQHPGSRFASLANNVYLCTAFQPRKNQGEVLEWLKRHAWKVCKRQKRFAGSNPALSAVYSMSDQVSETLFVALFFFIPTTGKSRGYGGCSTALCLRAPAGN